MNFFNDLLPDRLQKALGKMKYEKPTPIQEAAIPSGLKGSDIIGLAQTGTGKTAAFSIPLVAHCITDPSKRALILAPTRELAAQIRDVIDELSQFSGQARSALIVGGASMHRQYKALRGDPSIVIATPGRLIDHLQRKSIDLSKTTSVVLDEADRMLDMGFGPQIEEILAHLPKQRQSLLFSATFPTKIKKLAEAFLNDPKRIEVSRKEEPAPKIEQVKVEVAQDKKYTKVMEILAASEDKTLIFTRTKRGADRLTNFLEKNHFETACIHGDRSQSQRDRAIRAFRRGFPRVMVATDVASRGLDVDEIKLVINYDLPETSDDYTHRIGRTGRNGQVGQAISFVSSGEDRHWEYLQNPERGAQTIPSRRGKRGPDRRNQRDGRRPSNKPSRFGSGRKKAKTFSSRGRKPKRGPGQSPRSHKISATG